MIFNLRFLIFIGFFLILALEMATGTEQQAGSTTQEPDQQEVTEAEEEFQSTVTEDLNSEEDNSTSEVDYEESGGTTTASETVEEEEDKLTTVERQHRKATSQKIKTSRMTTQHSRYEQEDGRNHTTESVSSASGSSSIRRRKWQPKCGKTVCTGVAWYYGIVPPLKQAGLICIFNATTDSLDYTIYYCNQNQFAKAQQGFLFDAVCFGNFNITVAGADFWLNGKDLFKRNGTKSWENVTDTYHHITGYFAMLKNEGRGHFYCSSGGYGQAVIQAMGGRFEGKTPTLFYNGTYYGVAVRDGHIVNYQAEGQMGNLRFGPVIDRNLTTCSRSFCCWFQDYYIGDDSKSQGVVKYYYDGRRWLFWNVTGYVAFTGTTYTSSTLRKMIVLLSDLKLTYDRRTYLYKGNVTYRLLSSGHREVFKGSLQFDRIPYDQRAEGEAYVEVEGYIKYMNKTGVYYIFNISDGYLVYYKGVPSCSDGDDEDHSKSSIGSWSCEPMTVEYNSWNMIPCNPRESPGICGIGYQCLSPDIVSGLTCAMGFCYPDFQAICDATTTPETTPTTQSTTAIDPAPAANKKKYGSSCNYDSDCFTFYCSSKVCACPECTKILPNFEYDLRTSSVFYTEKCIPNVTVVVSENENCDLWTDYGRRVCGMGLVCAKCPEVWNSNYANATCMKLNLPTSSGSSASDTCPDSVECGYKASCVMIAGVPSCFCSDGYILESNFIDCYGWAVEAVGSCSVTCGNGYQTVNRTCNKKVGSSATCVGEARKTLQCTPGAACPLPVEKVSVAVLVVINSRVITLNLFNQHIETPVKEKLAEALNRKCGEDKNTFENQCCPGKTYVEGHDVSDCISPTNGTKFINKFSDGSKFQFYIVAEGNPDSTCCSTAAAASRVAKRSASDPSFDQDVLASVILSPDVMNTVEEQSRNVDPSAVLDSISAATTTTTSTTPPTSSNNNGETGNNGDTNQESESSDGLEPWVWGAIGGGAGGLLIIIGVIVAFVMMSKKKTENKIADSNWNDKTAEPIGTTQYPYGQQQQQSYDTTPKAYPAQSANPYGDPNDPNNPYAAYATYFKSGQNPQMENAAYPSYYGQYPQGGGPGIAPSQAYGN